MLTKSFLKLSNRFFNAMDLERLDELKFDDEGFGFDKFGFSPETALTFYSLFCAYFKGIHKLNSSGLANLPENGKCILYGNPSLPFAFESLLVIHDIILNSKTDKAPRGLMDTRFYEYPYIGNWLTRSGQVPVSKKNICALLEASHVVITFPNILRDIDKPLIESLDDFSQHTGFIESALFRKVPIIPVTIKSKMQKVDNPLDIDDIEIIGHKPYFKKIKEGLFYNLKKYSNLIIPTHFNIYYGKPINLHSNSKPKAHSDSAYISKSFLTARNALKDLIEKS